jgi:hypothetical protein
MARIGILTQKMLEFQNLPMKLLLYDSMIIEKVGFDKIFFKTKNLQQGVAMHIQTNYLMSFLKHFFSRLKLLERNFSQNNVTIKKRKLN